MENLYNFITDPSSLLELAVFVFGLGATWSNLNGRLKELERKTEELDGIKIETKLAEIQNDLQRVKLELQKISNK